MATEHLQGSALALYAEGGLGDAPDGPPPMPPPLPEEPQPPKLPQLDVERKLAEKALAEPPSTDESSPPSTDKSSPSPPPPPTICDSTVCFDCDVELDAQPWVSVSYGISLCLECAGHHRGLGTHVSFVRSLELDALTSREMRSLVLGGNAAFSVFLADRERSVPRHVWLALPIQTRYLTPAADLYRRQLATSLDEDEAQAAGALLGSEPVTAELSATLRRPEPSSPSAGAPPLPQAKVRWTPDSEAYHCQLCKASFGLVFNRRHHCRKCGRCVCDSCSPPESWKAIAGGEAVRHCKLCVAPTRVIAGLVPFAR